MGNIVLSVRDLKSTRSGSEQSFFPVNNVSFCFINITAYQIILLISAPANLFVYCK